MLTIDQFTFESQPEAGKPLSLANDQICREAVATSLIQQTVSKTMMIAVITFVPA